MNPGWGRGRGFGRGFGRRWFYGEPYAEPSQPLSLTKEEQKKILEAEVVELEAELKARKEKLKELK